MTMGGAGFKGGHGGPAPQAAGQGQMSGLRGGAAGLAGQGGGALGGGEPGTASSPCVSAWRASPASEV